YNWLAKVPILPVWDLCIFRHFLFELLNLFSCLFLLWHCFFFSVGYTVRFTKGDIMKKQLAIYFLAIGSSLTVLTACDNAVGKKEDAIAKQIEMKRVNDSLKLDS